MNTINGEIKKNTISFAEFKNYNEQVVSIKGYIHRIREMTGFSFVIIRTERDLIQCVYAPEFSDYRWDEKLVEEAYQALYTIAQNGGQVLFVGTRKQTQDVIKEEATRANMFYVDQRWLGGTLTNFKTIKKSIAKLYKFEQKRKS